MKSTEATAFGKAVGDATRQRILAYCCCERRPVGDISRHVGLRQPTVTHHMAILMKANLVKREQEGKQVYYSVDQKAVVNCCGQLMVNLAPNEEATRRIRKCC